MVCHFLLQGIFYTQESNPHLLQVSCLAGEFFTHWATWEALGFSSVQSVQSLSRVRLFETPWTAARQASLSITNSRSSLTHVHRVRDAIQPLGKICFLFCKSNYYMLHNSTLPSSNECGSFTGFNLYIYKTPVLWPPHVKSWLTGKDSHAGRDWGQEKGTTEDEMAGWHHWLDGRESEWTPGVGDGQGGLVCCDSRGRKELDTTERLNWTELNISQAQERTRA